jgi:hypothetical protein
MRVDAHSGHTVIGQGGASQGRPATSFAQILAAGQSIEAIRSERAFGFNETGMMGAARQMPTRSAGLQKSFTGHQPLNDKANNSLAKLLVRNHNSPVTAKIIEAGADAGIGQVTTPELIADDSPILLRDAKLNVANQPHRINAKMGVSIANTQATAMRMKRDYMQGKLALSGPDDGITISLVDDSINQNNYDSFFANFYQICQQFGVTLKVVRHIQKV